MNIKRGEIYLATLDPVVGREISKTRPVVVVSNDQNNQRNHKIQTQDQEPLDQAYDAGLHPLERNRNHRQKTRRRRIKMEKKSWRCPAANISLIIVLKSSEDDRQQHPSFLLALSNTDLFSLKTRGTDRCQKMNNAPCRSHQGCSPIKTASGRFRNAQRAFAPMLYF